MTQFDALGATLDFTAEDLAANRSGRLTPRQLAKLTRARGQGRAVSVVMGLLMLGFVVVIAVVELPKVKKSQGSDSIPIVPIVAGVLVLILLIVGLSLLRTRRAVNRLVGSVQHVEGPVRTRAHRIRGNVNLDSAPFEYGGGMRYEVTVGPTMFFVRSRATLDAFEDGRTYRAYYTGANMIKSLISAERL